MAQRTFKQVLAEVNSKSNPQRQTILNQIADIPRQQIAEESSLAAQKDRAYEDILGGARQRGLGFSGIPLGEQAKYAATEYAPAVARLKTGFTQQKGSLQSALADIGRENYMNAQNIFQADRSFAEQQRQYNLGLQLQREQMKQQERLAAQSAAAASSASGMDYLSALLGGGGSQSKSKSKAAPSYGFKNGKNGRGGFYFNDAQGRAISAATYAKMANISLPQLLTKMAKAGDATALAVSRQLRGPGVTPQLAKRYRSLFWGS